jgi:type I restriction enzyme M protein
VSLPSGVFLPYSGVKTSILLLDRHLANKSKSVAFVKINADGYELGTTKRPIEQNDLPDALNILQSFRNGKEQQHDLVTYVSKEQIASDGKFNLLGSKYLSGSDYSGSKWPMAKLSDFCKISAGGSAPQEPAFFESGIYPFFRTSDVGAVHLSTNLVDVRDYLNDEGIRGLKLFKKGTILFPKSGASTFLNHRAIMGRDGYVVSHLGTIYPDPNKASSKYIYYLLIQIDARDITADQSYPSLRLEDIGNIEVPLPPLAEQLEVVKELERHERGIEEAQAQIFKFEELIQEYVASQWY